MSDAQWGRFCPSYSRTRNSTSGRSGVAKGYDAADFIKALVAAGVEAIIPPRVNRPEQRQYDKHLYRERHRVECFINNAKHYRRVFSSFEKLSKNYLGFLSFVSALVWLR